MNIEGQTSSETQPEVDTEAAVAEISQELFGQGTEGGGSEVEAPVEGEQEKSAGTETSVDTPAPQAGEEKPEGEAKSGETDNSTEVQETGAPKTWTKEALQDWASIPPRAQAEILKREEDFMRGISQYKEAADLGVKYSEVVKPYEAILTAEQVDPVQLFQSFSANHYLLSRGTPEQKLQVAANLIEAYGLDLNAVNDFIGNRIVEPTDPKIAALEREIAELKGAHEQRTSVEREAAVEATAKIVEEFKASAPYFDEVAEDIALLLEKGLAKDLPDAYERAVYANPVTRAKEIERVAAEKASKLAAEEQARREKIARSTGADVKTEGHERNGTVPVGSLDDTLAATLRDISARA